MIRDSLKINSVMTIAYPCSRTSFIKLEADVGDQVRILKFVSGVMYLARNLRTNLTGQITKDCVVDFLPRIVSSGASNGLRPQYNPLDNMEASAAAEWNDESSIGDSHEDAKSPSSILQQSMASMQSGGQDTVTMTRQDLDNLLEQKVSILT